MTLSTEEKINLEKLADKDDFRSSRVAAKLLEVDANRSDSA